MLPGRGKNVSAATELGAAGIKYNPPTWPAKASKLPIQCPLLHLYLASKGTANELQFVGEDAGATLPGWGSQLCT
jgi:hypothetical protein